MKPGSIVETVGNFEQARKVWGLPYPKVGQPLTIAAITHHPNEQAHKQGIVLLHFEEIPNLPGLCDKTIHGQRNFVELNLPEDIKELLNGEYVLKQKIKDYLSKL